MIRNDNRQSDDLRKIILQPGYLDYAEGSCFATAGNTKVIAAVTIQHRVPPFLVNTGKGWLTAEYSLLPRSTKERVQRETFGRSGRTQEIMRFIGRSLRGILNLDIVGERTFIVDCDIIQADGGTRTLSVTAGFCALYESINKLIETGELRYNPITEFVGAISVGIVNGEILLDLSYEEDSKADVDMNVVMTETGRFIEIQSTAEGMPFTRKQIDEMLNLTANGIYKIIEMEHKIFESKGV